MHNLQTFFLRPESQIEVVRHPDSLERYTGLHSAKRWSQRPSLGNNCFYSHYIHCWDIFSQIRKPAWNLYFWSIDPGLPRMDTPHIKVFAGLLGKIWRICLRSKLRWSTLKASNRSCLEWKMRRQEEWALSSADWQLMPLLTTKMMCR